MLGGPGRWAGVSFPPLVTQAVLCALVTGWASRKTPSDCTGQQPATPGAPGTSQDNRLEPEAAHQPPSMGCGPPVDGIGFSGADSVS